MILQEAALLAALGGFCTLAGQHLYRRFFGTTYRTQKQCNDCETRRAVRDIRRMTQELAIKAGVPVHEALKVGAEMDLRTGTEG